MVQTWLDDDGRYAFANLRISDRIVSVGANSAPTGANAYFLLRINQIIAEISTTLEILGEDWNLEVDAFMDRIGPIDSANNGDRVIKGDNLTDHLASVTSF